ncbi:uncharacterized protein [Dermacentor andersoni]|uniref:uncharacterized protein n=1 Tax=Dermacentor andersoni TaxID=34620 RepID=UPI0021550526|nr:uncharacterized protein LOC126541971 [Dermacentor andersoni]
MSVNQRRLTTPFDVHATLKALALLPRKLSLEPTHRGRSLLASIPANRSCVDAFVPLDYCACVEGPQVDSPLASPGTLSLAQHALEFINNAIGSSPLLKDMCATYVLRRVEHVDDHQSRVTSATSINTSSSDNVLIIVSTIPGAIFSIRARMIPAGAEAEVKAGSRSSIRKGHKVEIMEAERIDRYADDVSKCVKLANGKLRRYCYCKDIALSDHME